MQADDFDHSYAMQEVEAEVVVQTASTLVLGPARLVGLMPRVRERPLHKRGEGAGFFLGPENFFRNTLESRNYHLSRSISYY